MRAILSLSVGVAAVALAGCTAAHVVGECQVKRTVTVATETTCQPGGTSTIFVLPPLMIPAE